MARTRRNFHAKSLKRKVTPRLFKATCSGCGKDLMLEVSPPAGKSLLCLDCFNK